MRQCKEPLLQVSFNWVKKSCLTYLISNLQHLNRPIPHHKAHKIAIVIGINLGRRNQGDTRIFSPAMVPGLSVTIGHQLNQSKRLKLVWDGSICRFEHIGANSSGKVVTKWASETHVTGWRSNHGRRSRSNREASALQVNWDLKPFQFE